MPMGHATAMLLASHSQKGHNHEGTGDRVPRPVGGRTGTG